MKSEECVRLGHLCCKHCYTFIKFTEDFCLAEVVEVQSTQSACCFSITFRTYWTENMSAVISKQLVENVDAKITCSASKKNIVNRQTVAFTERSNGVLFQNGVNSLE